MDMIEETGTIPFDEEVDLGSLSCGDLAIGLMKALKPLAVGKTLKARTVGPGAKSDIPAACRMRKDELLAMSRDSSGEYYYIRRGGGRITSKFAISLTHAAEDADRATVALVVANASVGAGVETLLWLSVEGVWLGEKGYADRIQVEGFAPARELLHNFTSAGGQVLLCAPCAQKRGIEAANLIPNAAIAGGAKLVEFLSGGGSSVTY